MFEDYTVLFDIGGLAACTPPPPTPQSRVMNVNITYFVSLCVKIVAFFCFVICYTPTTVVTYP